MKKIASLIAVLAALAFAAPASALTAIGPPHGEFTGTCYLGGNIYSGGSPAYDITADMNCFGTYPMDIRVCPQHWVNGGWQFIPGGTCSDTGWFSATGGENGEQFIGIVGDGYQAWAEVWVWINGKEYHAVDLSGYYTCCS